VSATTQSRSAAVRTLHPGYFALVMATGIVSVAMSNDGMAGFSMALLASCGDLLADLRDPQRAFALFTFVAATDVPGTRLMCGVGSYHLGQADHVPIVKAIGAGER
jgi:hypothetical protein